MDHFIQTDGLRLHALEQAGGTPALVFLPGLTANLRAFDALIAAGLSPRFRTVAIDFRGRGLSDKPASGYAMADYAADVLAVMDALGIAQAAFVGHSFGAFVGMMVAAAAPERLRCMVILDSSHLLIRPETVPLIKASLDRLDRQWASLDAYLADMRQMPYLNGRWDRDVERYFTADVEDLGDGRVQPRTRSDIISQTIDGQFDVDWGSVAAALTHPTLLLNAVDPLGPPGAPVLLPPDVARATAEILPNCRYQAVTGNHYTMIFGDNAAQLTAVIAEFVEQSV